MFIIYRWKDNLIYNNTRQKVILAFIFHKYWPTGGNHLICFGFSVKVDIQC